MNALKNTATYLKAEGIWKGRPVKELTERLKNTGGRNNQGRVTCPTKSNMGKRRIGRKIDFKRQKDGIKAVVERLEKDPHRTSYIALIRYEDGELSYILAPKGLKAGDTIISGKEVMAERGNSCELQYIPVKTHVHCVELNPGKGGKLARSAGTFAIIEGKEPDAIKLVLSSGEKRLVPGSCRATVGELSNELSHTQIIGNAGRNRHMGRKPTVRGVAKNPVDHPNGGDTSGGKTFRSRTGKMKKGQRTRNPKRASSKLIISRRKK